MGEEIQGSKLCYKRVVVDLAVVKIVNSKLVEQVANLERRCWVNSQYYRRERLEVSGVPSSVSGEELENILWEIFSKIGVVTDSGKIQACHRRKKDNRTIVLSNRNDYLQTFRVKKDSKIWYLLR